MAMTGGIGQLTDFLCFVKVRSFWYILNYNANPNDYGDKAYNDINGNNDNNNNNNKIINNANNSNDSANDDDK